MNTVYLLLITFIVTPIVTNHLNATKFNEVLQQKHNQTELIDNDAWPWEHDALIVPDGEYLAALLTSADKKVEEPKVEKKIRLLFRLKKDQGSDCQNNVTNGGKASLPRTKRTYVRSGEGSKKKLPCLVDGCNASFDYPSQLKTHEKMHSGERDFPCSVCEKSFPTQTRLKTHLLVHTSKKNFRCKNCCKRFKYKAALKAHEKDHNPKDLFECSTCNQMFSSIGNLRKHIKNIHENIKSYVCPKKNCQRRFTQSNHLKTHMASHSEKKSHVCTLCQRAFGLKEYLNRHIKRVHTGAI